MGFFTMIGQQTSWDVFPALYNSANASVRLVSSFYRFSAHSHYRLISPLKSNAACSSHDSRYCNGCSSLQSL
jgi:hypothetical protein